MFCPKCGTQNPDGVTFCGSCATPLEAAAQAPEAAQAAGAPPPIPGGPAHGAPPPGTGGRNPLLIVLVVVGVLALAAVAALIFVLVTGDDGPQPTPTPFANTSASGSASPTASTSASASPSASPSATPTDAPVTTIVAAFGAHSETLGTMDTVGNGAFLDTAVGKTLDDLQWSPDGKLIAYQERNDRYGWRSTLMVYDVAAGSAKPVSFGAITPKVVYGYAWVSPTEIVAAAFATLPKWRLKNGTLYRCDVAAGTAEPMKDGDGATLEGVDPSASTDGSRLAFCSYSPLGKSELTESLRLYDADSGAVSTVADATVYAEIEGRAFDRPLLSPDGTQIFTEQTGSDVGFGVTIYSVEGAKLASIDHLLFPCGAAWDKSGSGRLVFGGRRKELGESSVFMYDSATSDITTAFKLPPGGDDGYGNLLRDFAWSPDGDWIAYTIMSPRYDYNTEDLWMARTDGSDKTRVSRDAVSPSWADAVVPGAQPGDL